MKLSDRQWFRYFVFLLVLLDIVGIMFYQGSHRSRAQDLSLIISGLATCVVSVARFVGWGDKDKITLGFKNLDQLFGDRYVQIFIFFFTGILTALLVFPNFMGPRRFDLSVYIIPPDSAGVQGWVGEVNLYRTDDTRSVPTKIDGRPVKSKMNNDLFKELDKDNDYQVDFRPFDEEMFQASASQSKVAEPVLSLPLIYKRHKLEYSLAPDIGKLVFKYPGGLKRDTLRGKDSKELEKGRYEYEFGAGENYTTLSSAFSVPRDTLRLELRPKEVSISFFANRGLGSRSMIVQSRFTITQGSFTIRSDVASGEWIRLRAGEKYTVSAVGREPWDLKSRIYRGSCQIKPTGSPNETRDTIAVEER